MKILMVNKFLYPRGGSESYMLALGECFTKMGHQVEYFGMYDEQNTVGNSAGQYTKNMDFHSTGLERFLYPFRILYSREAKRKIGEVLDRFQPDVVHMNNINFQLTPSIIYAIKKRGIPLVQTVHDYQMICPNHLLYNFEKNEPCERCLGASHLGCIKNRCIHGSLVKSILGFLEAKLYRILNTYQKVDLFVCPSHFLEQKLHSAKSFYQGKTYTIHNFINKKQFVKTSDTTEPYILFVGRLFREKGVQYLKETAQLLPEYTFLVAGNGPDEEILSGVRNLKRLGFLTGDSLTEVMGNARLLLLPSVCYEHCPLTILEAHSMGIPVVTMNYGGMAELVENGVTGTLAEEATPEGIAQAIRKTMSDETYYNKLKEACETRKDSIFSVEDYCNILLEKYQSLTGGGEPDGRCKG